jgi:HAD superfamily hydrolase (TIGR01509 family)
LFGYPAGVVFDLDGTIVDTEDGEYAAVRDGFGDFGIDYPPEKWAAIIGVSWAPNWLDELATQVGPSFDREAARARYRQRRQESIATLVPLPGVIDLFEQALTAGIPIAVASNSPLVWVEERLEQLGLRRQVEAIAAVDTVTEAKPAAAPYLEACAAIGVGPTCSVAFEDSSTGVASATAAGLYTVACPHGLSKYHDLSAADLLVDTLAGLDLRAVGDDRCAQRLSQ